MKKNKYLISTGLLVTTMTVLPSMVLAEGEETTSTKKSETASFQLIEGDFILETGGLLDFGSHKIEKKKKVVSTAFGQEFSVTDARGTQAGWELTVEATPFTIVEPEGGWIQQNPYQLPNGSLLLGNIVDLNGTGNEKVEHYPTANQLGFAIDLSQAIKVLEAPDGKGMGKYQFSFGHSGLSLVIDPATAKIDKVNYPNGITPYEATITWNLIAGPVSTTEPEQEESYEEYSEDLTPDIGLPPTAPEYDYDEPTSNQPVIEEPEITPPTEGEGTDNGEEGNVTP